MWLISGSVTHPGISQHFPGQHSGELDLSPVSSPFEFVCPHTHGMAFIWRLFVLVYCNMEFSCVFNKSGLLVCCRYGSVLLLG